MKKNNLVSSSSGVCLDKPNIQMLLVQSSIIFIIHNRGPLGLFGSFCFYSFFSHSQRSFGTEHWNFSRILWKLCEIRVFQTSLSWLLLPWLGYLHTAKTSRLGANREKTNVIKIVGIEEQCTNMHWKKNHPKNFWSTCGLVGVGFSVPHPDSHPQKKSSYYQKHPDYSCAYVFVHLALDTTVPSEAADLRVADNRCS